MNKVIFRLIVGFPLVVAPAVSLAGQPVDNYSATALTTAQYHVAVAQLEPIVKRDRADESLLLNLAMAYRHVGRVTDANALYRRVLMMEDVDLDTATGGTVSSHAMARFGLKTPTVLSQR